MEEKLKAWQLVREHLDREKPCYNPDDNEVFWEEQNDGPEQAADGLCKVYYCSKVPGSRATEAPILDAVQAMENRGYIVENGVELYQKGKKAVAENNMVEALRCMYLTFEACNNARKDENSDYWKQHLYENFDEYASAVQFPQAKKITFDEEHISRQKAGWLAQIIGGAYGTCIEGYTGKNIKEKYNGEVTKYIRKPNTFNDDNTYELALLCAHERFGKKTTAIDIANEWLCRIPTGWSAEQWALNNLKAGVLPPYSGLNNNPFNEWIGAQMRGVICGQIYPGNPYKAAQCAWMDGSISHAHNGILGEVFNAIMASLAFTETDIKTIIEKSVELMPEDSGYGQVVRAALKACKEHEDYASAWAACEPLMIRYNWIHVYPNAMIQIIALWFGEEDFEKTISACGGCGMDVDCNAAQILTVLGIMRGLDWIPSYWSAPFGDRMDTYVRGLKVLSIGDLSRRTAAVAETLYEEK